MRGCCCCTSFLCLLPLLFSLVTLCVDQGLKMSSMEGLVPFPTIQEPSDPEDGHDIAHSEPNSEKQSSIISTCIALWI